MAEYEVRVAPGAVCDFCSSDEPRHIEEAPTFEFDLAPDVKATSREGWASCSACHQLVARRDWQGLHDRAVRNMTRKHPEVSVANVKRAVREMHARFRAHQP